MRFLLSFLLSFLSVQASSLRLRLTEEGTAIHGFATVEGRICKKAVVLNVGGATRTVARAHVASFVSIPDPPIPAQDRVAVPHPCTADVTGTSVSFVAIPASPIQNRVAALRVPPARPTDYAAAKQALEAEQTAIDAYIVAHSPLNPAEGAQVAARRNRAYATFLGEEIKPTPPVNEPTTATIKLPRVPK